MALSHRSSSYDVRPPNKEPEWSTFCNSVFDQYLDSEDLFVIKGGQPERHSSEDSGHLFDFSGSSERSNQTNATSPIPPWDGIALLENAGIEAKQPRAKVPGDFWPKKLRALEQNAAECERRQQHLSNSKSNPDFLSLGGYPSPPAIPRSRIDQSISAQRQRSRSAANGKKASTPRSATKSRSVSRGRPTGMTKPSASTNAYATVRKSNASPSKMMNPSRYRAGFHDVWAERVNHNPKRYELRVPSPTFPDSPPPSARLVQDDFAAFGSPVAHTSSFRPDDLISPLTNAFDQAARIYTPIGSPVLSPGSCGAQLDFHSSPHHLSDALTTTQHIALNATTPLHPEINPLAAARIQSFDFGFSNCTDKGVWSAAAPLADSRDILFGEQDPFSDMDAPNLPETNPPGLGISRRSNTMHDYTTLPDNPLLPNTIYEPPPISTASPFYLAALPSGLVLSPTRLPKDRPTTPQRRRQSRSPSPPATESRARRASSSRRISRHRKTKSTGSTPRQAQNADEGGFVNYTAQDGNKLLSGVAPSGSSKTKARRDKEEADKRKRFSQAAIQAVREAGGDVGSLQKAGLISG